MTAFQDGRRVLLRKWSRRVIQDDDDITDREPETMYLLDAALKLRVKSTQCKGSLGMTASKGMGESRRRTESQECSTTGSVVQGISHCDEAHRKCGKP